MFIWMIFVEIFNKSGTHIVLKKHHILIDPLANHESDIVLISHGHSDHVNIQAFKKLSQPIYLSRPTLEILNERAKTEIKKKNIHIIKNGDRFKFNGITIQAFNAGHCIGSLQFKIRYNQEVIIYTGDFCVETRIGMQKGSILKGKNAVLITDATYSAREYDFPPRMKLYKKILKWIESVFQEQNHSTAVIFARKLGTAQELTGLINNSTLNCELWVHPSIYYHNLIHTRYYPLGNFQYRKNLFDSSLDDFLFPKGSQCKRNKVVLLPIFMYNRKYLPQIKRVFGREAIAICTGWALTEHFSVRSFALSSHADYKNIQKYKIESGAKELLYF